MYHDQALIPLKALEFDEGVNVTLGLPIVRTSVDHGTALDLAGTGRADPSSLEEALATALALVTRDAPHLIVLDEPTNDLDLETLDLLQEVISDYDGTVLIVSHDRDFLDRTVTLTLGLSGSGKVDIVAGGYADWEKQRSAPKAAPAKPPSTAPVQAPAPAAAAPLPTSGMFLRPANFRS
mgnify:CR=1 FL=1